MLKGTIEFVVNFCKVTVNFTTTLNNFFLPVIGSNFSVFCSSLLMCDSEGYILQYVTECYVLNLSQCDSPQCQIINFFPW
jgi:hypothetical protein